MWLLRMLGYKVGGPKPPSQALTTGHPATRGRIRDRPAMHVKHRWVLGVSLISLLAGLAAACSSGSSASDSSNSASVSQPKPDSAGVIWLCRPGQANDPCLASLDTTVVKPDGGHKIVDYRAATNPPINCFYLYPYITVQRTPNANLHVDPQEIAIAELEASPFSQDCRVFAPMYREKTDYTSSSAQASAADSVAYNSALAAWNDYLAHYNDGRGVVLIGHSEGSGVLTQLLTQHIDQVPSVRRLLVSAILTGANDVSYTSGFGPLKTIGPCQTASQTGCVVDYNAYTELPQGALFGKMPSQEINGHAVQVLCTNPANLSGGPGSLISMYRLQLPTQQVEGSSIQGVLTGSSPKATTPWIEYDGGYSASCVTQNGYHFLKVTSSGRVPQLSSSSPAPTWGLHVDDPNLAMGNLIALVRSETNSFENGNS